MTMMNVSPMRMAAICVASLGLGGCAALQSMVGDFEKRWDDPNAALELETAAKPITPEQKAQFVARLDSFSPEGDCNEVAGVANQVLAVDDVNTSALLVLGECDLKARDLASAKSRFEIVAQQARGPRALRGLGAIAVLEERPEDAKSHLQAAMAYDDLDWKVWNNLGYAEDLLQSWDEAEAAYKRAAELNPDSPAPLNNLGMSYFRQGRYDEAITVFDAALMRDPSLEIAELNMRIAQAMNGDYANALAGADESERAVILNNMGVAAMARGETDTAKKMFREALDASPTFYAVAYNNLERAQLNSQE